MTMGWFNLHAHLRQDLGGCRWRKDPDTNEWIETPQQMKAYVFNQLTRRREHDKFILHQPAPWVEVWDGGNEMAAAQYYAVGPNSREADPAMREAVMMAIRAAKTQRPEIEVGVYGGLMYKGWHTTRHDDFLYHPLNEGHETMFTMNVCKWRDAGISFWLLDAGGKPERRMNLIEFAARCRALGIDCGVEPIVVNWDADDIDDEMAVEYPSISDARFVYKHGPWELPEGHADHYVNLHKNVRVMGENVPPTDERLRPFFEQCLEMGYKLSCDYRYDDYVKELTSA